MPGLRGARRVLLTTCVVLTAALGAASDASAAEQQAYAAAMSYATPTITMGEGDTLTFTNLDNLAKHDLLGHNGEFGSDLLGAGESGPVKGAEKLKQGQYQFHCSLHGWMQGVLNVGPAGSGGPGGEVGGGGGTPTAPSQGNQDPYDSYLHATKGSIGDASWPFYGNTLAGTRDGGQDGPSAAEAPNLGVAWSFYSREGDFTGTPVVAKGMVLAGSNGGVVYAIDAATGRQRWSHSTGSVINGSLAVSGNRVFVPIAEPHAPRVMALDLKTGKHLWSTQISDQKNSDVYGSPVVWKGRVFMGVSALYGEYGDENVNVRGQVVALSEKTGKVKWNTFMVPPGHDGGAVWTTPAVDPKTATVYVGTGNAYHEPAADTTDAMISLDAYTGAIKGKFQATAGDVWNGTSNAAEGPDYDFGASPQLFTGPDGKELVGEGQKAGVYHALDRHTMAPVWQRQVGPGAFVIGGIIGSTATDGKQIYGPSTVGGELWSIGMDGGYKWFSTDGGPLKFNATSVANGVVYTTDMTGFLVAREATTGLVLNRIPLGGPSWGGVSVAGGTVFAAVGSQSSSGYIAAYRVRQGDEESQGAEHFEDKPEQDPDEYLAQQEQSKKKKSTKKKCKAKNHRHADGKNHPHKAKCKKSKKSKKKKKGKKPAESADHPDDGHEHEAEGGGDSAHEHADNTARGGAVLKASRERGDRYVPKKPGTTEHLSLYYGPYTVPPGWDMNRLDLELPTQNGFLLALEPAMRRVQDLSEPMHTEGHIHHAHWFGFDPGNAEDNYFKQLGPGTHEWVFGNGDEETRADFRRRSAADPNGPVYGNYLPAGRNQEVIYMLHNKTAQPMEVWIVLDVVFQHGTRAQLEELTKRQYRDVNGMLMGRTFNVPRQKDGDGEWENIRDQKTADGKERPIEWVAPRDGTMIGTGGHLHPGGTEVTMENYGSPENPCPADKKGRGYGGTLLLDSDIINRNAPLSEDYQTEVTHPAWRAPIRKGDRIRISGTYANKDHAYYYAMTHAGFYFDYEEAPKGRCKPYVVGPAKKKVKDPTAGVPNRPWTMEDEYCGWGKAKPCEKPEEKPADDAFARQNVVHIANFQYLPGDRAASNPAGGKIPSVKQGEQITFVNDDQFANIRHTVTTCPWPCNGRYVANYPHADGAWDSDTLGFDPIDGGTPNPRAQTPADLAPGLYTYFCRIHPWMRGAFRIEPPGPGGGSSSGLGLPSG